MRSICVRKEGEKGQRRGKQVCTSSLLTQSKSEGIITERIEEAK